MSPDKKPPANNPDSPAKAPAKSAQPELARPPVHVIDGIPGRSANLAIWKYVVLAIIFLAWVAFLIYIRSGGAE
jgi:hypothetical protein